MEYGRTCPTCKNEFITKSYNSVYCNPSCRPSIIRMEAQKARAKLGINAGNTGALSELLTAADLIKKGCHVFRSVSPAAPCDMIILKDGKLRRVEVTTGQRLANNELSSPAHDKEKYDILATVIIEEGFIKYEPELEEK